MVDEKLQVEFEVLHTDLSGLVHTGAGKPFYKSRINKNGDGKYGLASLPEIKSPKDRAEAILGAILPIVSADSVMFWHSNIDTGQIPEEVLAIKPLLEQEDKKCVTLDRDVFNVLLLLRYEGILEFGKTPSCVDRNPDEFLRQIIADSTLTYKDTLLAILEYAEKHILSSQTSSSTHSESIFFINDDPHTSASEKFDRAVMLLSLLSAEDIHNYGKGNVDESVNTFTSFFSSAAAKVMPYFYVGCSHLKDLFSENKLKDSKDNDEKIRSFRDVFFDLMVQYGMPNDNPIAFDDSLYHNALIHCANSGVSCSSWLYNAEDIQKALDAGVKSWLFNHFDDQVADLVMNHKGYYLIAQQQSDIMDSEKFFGFRKYIVDNHYLQDVWFNSVDMDVTRFFECYEIDTRCVSSSSVRFFNFGNISLDEEYNKLDFFLAVEETSKANKVYKFISAEEIASNGYRLKMSLYNSSLLASYSNPVALSDILTTLDCHGCNSKNADCYYDYECASSSSLLDDPLSNYNERAKVGLEWSDDKSVIVKSPSVLALRKSWPMKPTWIECDESKVSNAFEGIIIREDDADRNVMAFSVDTKIANPWYIAYRLSQETSQFNDRSANDGSIDRKNLLKICVDLPTLPEQTKIVEGIISKELDRKKKQIGTVDTLFNLSHTIGLSANRIQSILGNLKDTCIDKPDLYADLKKIGDNFNYILRVINSTSKDFSVGNDPVKPIKILPLLEKFVSAFSSLPFGLDPVIKHDMVPSDLKLIINETLMSIIIDNILRNAHRHGFHKVVSKDNKVSIELSLVRHDGKAYYMMSFCNNGDRLENSFTVYDYISRGKTGKSTGNTGQGGYDIYQIVRKFGGKLGLRSNDEWNFILDILIPLIEEEDTLSITDYRYGSLV
ncbi:MAG: hypothetical protein MJY76_03605 [Bacteroidales bacterium]|nr:hypothetical protein [Bacteroidales bacterium]